MIKYDKQQPKNILYINANMLKTSGFDDSFIYKICGKLYFFLLPSYWNIRKSIGIFAKVRQSTIVGKTFETISVCET